MWQAWLARLRTRLRPATAAGLAGETAAAAELRRRGYTVVVRNWRHGRDELDLVCRDGEVLVFVEVKTRAAHARVGGFDAIDRRKRRALRRAAHAYLAGLARPPRSMRFDAVEVEHRDGVVTAIRHFENVELFSKFDHCDRGGPGPCPLR